MAELVGNVEVVARFNTKDYDAGKKHVEKGNQELEGSAKRTERNTNTAFNNIAKVGLAAVAAAATAVGVAITTSIGGAVRRIDTLNNASRTFENIGFASDDVSKSMNALEKSITGLPTPLDSAVRGMTALASTYSDINKGQKVFSALNNAILGFGGTTAMVENAITQLSQLPMDGPLDAQTWNSLRNSGLTPVLVAMAKDMGKSVNQMKSDFGEGILTVEDFTDALIKMDTQGGGGMKSLEQIAKDATGGIGTSWENMRTAITRGVASVIDAIGSEDIAKAITRIGKAFENALKDTSPFIQFIKRNKDFIVPIILGVSTFIGLITSLFVAIKLVTAATAIWNAVLNANPLGLILITLTAIGTALYHFFTNTEKGRKAFEVLRNIATDAWNSIKKGWGTAVDLFNEVWDNIKKGVDEVKKKFDEAVTAVKDWYKENEKAIQNIGIVITTILLPKIVQIGVQFTVTAAKAVASAAITSGAWVASALTTSAIWLTSTLPRLMIGFAMTSARAVVNALIISAAFVASSATTLASWVATFAKYLLWLGILAAQTIIAGGRMALGFMLAMGPLGLIAALVIGVAALIINNWDRVKGWFVNFWNWLKTSAQNTWNTVKGWFVNIGTAVGDAVANAFKSAVNAMLGFIEARINNVVDIMNNAIHLIDNITPGSLGRIDRVALPRLAKGGIVSSATIAMIGEGSEPEAVIPLSKLDKMLSGEMQRGNSGGDTINIHLDGVMARSRSDLREIGKDIIRAIDEERTARGLKPINGVTP